MGVEKEINGSSFIRDLKETVGIFKQQITEFKSSKYKRTNLNVLCLLSWLRNDVSCLSLLRYVYLKMYYKNICRWDISGTANSELIQEDLIFDWETPPTCKKNTSEIIPLQRKICLSSEKTYFLPAKWPKKCVFPSWKLSYCSLRF